MINRGVYSATCSILRDDYSLNVDATIAHAASTINNAPSQAAIERETS